MEFESEIKIRTREAEEIVLKYMPDAESAGEQEGIVRQGIIMDAMNYSIRSGGKRLRPMLMLETYRMFGGRSAVVEPFMAAIEMIHTYSLIHDDLPAMDDDDYRRGRKTTHVVYGEAMGILAGDALLNYAFETAAGAFSYQEELPLSVRAMQILAHKSGIFGMLGGQVVDVQNEGGGSVAGEILDFIYRLKTGALLEAAMTIGAVLAGASDGHVAAIGDVAAKTGMAFQIQDDILDVTGTAEELGKPVGSDEKNGKVTYVTLYGLEKARECAARLTEEAVAVLDSLPVKNEFLHALLLYLMERRK